MIRADGPTTDDVRDIWVDYHLNPLPRAEGVALVPEYQAAFDAWLETIRADERDQESERNAPAVLHLLKTADEYRTRLADLRAKVETLRDELKAKAYAVRDTEGWSNIMLMVAGVQKVLDLIDRSSDG